MVHERGHPAPPRSPESSGRDSPVPRLRNSHLGEESPIHDKPYRRYAAGIDKALSAFESPLEEWADYISFLNRLLKALQARPTSARTIPAKATVAQRLSQCLSPELPSGVHQKTLEIYHLIFKIIGKYGLSQDLSLFFPGLAPTLSFASFSVRSPFLSLLETHFINLEAKTLRPSMKSIILALLPGLEDETSEEFDRTLQLLANFKAAVRPEASQKLTEKNTKGDGFFWQCFFLSSMTSQSRRAGALAYLVRNLPPLASSAYENSSEVSRSQLDSSQKLDLSDVVTSPEPGLLVRCFASGLNDEQVLIQRGFLDLLVSHLPLSSNILQSLVKPQDLQLLLKAVIGVVIRRDMSLIRRLWAWLLGPEPQTDASARGDLSPDSPHQHVKHSSSQPSYFQLFGQAPLTQALLDMIRGATQAKPSERTRPYKICLSLMDRWEIGGLLVPEVFYPIVQSVFNFQRIASTQSEFLEILRSASVFFDGVESGLIFSELIALFSAALEPGTLTLTDRIAKISLVTFIVTHFNIREEEMIICHIPLTCLAALSMLRDLTNCKQADLIEHSSFPVFMAEAFSAIALLLEPVPNRAFPSHQEAGSTTKKFQQFPASISATETVEMIRAIYSNEQRHPDNFPPAVNPVELGEQLLKNAFALVLNDMDGTDSTSTLGIRIRTLIQILSKTPAAYTFDVRSLLRYLKNKLEQEAPLHFTQFSQLMQLIIQLFNSKRMDSLQLSGYILPLVRHAWFFLSSADPKFHVEAARSLWQLQTVMTASCREIEAALASILIESKSDTAEWNRFGEAARTFGVLWSHVLQDAAFDRRKSSVESADTATISRLAGVDSYRIMLTQPVFLVLDGLSDDGTQSCTVVKGWLNNMVGLDRLVFLLVAKFTELPFLSAAIDQTAPLTDVVMGEADELDLSIYLLQTFRNVLISSADKLQAVLMARYVAISEAHVQLCGESENCLTMWDRDIDRASQGKSEDAISLHDYFVRVSLACVSVEAGSYDNTTQYQLVSQLHRCASIVLHQLLSNDHAPQSDVHLVENVLFDRLTSSLEAPNPHLQVLLQDAIYDFLSLRQKTPNQQPDTPTVSSPLKLSIEQAQSSSRTFNHERVGSYISWPQLSNRLLRALQSGIGSAKSHTVLENWMSFLSRCLPLFAELIFQMVIPLVETICEQMDKKFSQLRQIFQVNVSRQRDGECAPESSLIHLLSGLEQLLALAHDQLLATEGRVQLMRAPDQSQSLFGSMMSGVFQNDAPPSRSATANNRLTVDLAFHDALRVCYKIWSWGQGEEAKKLDPASLASFSHTSLRLRNRARKLMEHLFAAEILECLETLVDIWKLEATAAGRAQVFDLLSSLDACRPRLSIPALFNSIYSRANPAALELSRKSTMTITLQDADLVQFLVDFAQSLDDDAMDEIWQDCMVFLKDLLGNPFPHRQTLPILLLFSAVLGEKVDNTNFGEQRRMRRELGDIFLRLLAALFTTRPMIFSESGNLSSSSEKLSKDDGRRSAANDETDPSDDIPKILSMIVPKLHKILLESERVQSAAASISTNFITPALRSRSFPDTLSRTMLKLFRELSRLPNNHKIWKKDVSEALDDSRFFSINLSLVQDEWFPILKHWMLSEKEKLAEIASRISAPTTPGIVFGVGATSARLEADRKTQLSLRKIATLILASAEDGFITDLPVLSHKIAELLTATSISSPSSTTRADVYMILRALVLKTSTIHLARLWPIINSEIYAAITSVLAPDHSLPSETYVNGAVLQACKLLDLLICVAPDDFQLHEWLFITDTIDAIYRPTDYQPVAVVDELSEELGTTTSSAFTATDQTDTAAAGTPLRRPLLGPGGISDDISLDRKDELVAKVLRPFFGQLSIFAFEATYAMKPLDVEACMRGVAKDIFDERTIVKTL